MATVKNIIGGKKKFCSHKEVDCSSGLEKKRRLDLTDLMVSVHIYMQENVRG